MNRRTLIKTGTIAGMASLLPFQPLFASAITNIENKAIGYKRFTLGELEVTVLTDGHIFAKPVQPFMAPLGSEAEVKKILEANFRPTDAIDLAMNVLLVKDKNRLILLDAGLGIFADANNGWLLKSLAEVGYSPKDITDILTSHAHPDHIGGLVNKQNQLVYPNAKIFMSRIEYDFWQKASITDFGKSELKHQADSLKQIIAGIQKVLNTIKPKLEYYDLDKSLYGNYSFQLVPGHTPGMVMITIKSQGQSLKYIADLIHSDVLLFPHPEWGFSGDTDLELATATRIKVLKELAADKIKVFAYHLPWPGIGHATSVGNAFNWVPEAYAIP